MITKSIFKRLFKLLLNYKRELLLTLIFTILISIIGVLDSLLLSYLIDNVLYSNAKITLITIAIVMFLIALLQISLKGLKNLFIQKISFKMDIDLTRKFYSKILQIQYSFFEKHKTGELTSRLNDTRMVRNALSEGLISILANIIMFFVVGFALFKLNSTLFLIQFISVIILTFVVLYFAKFYSKTYPKSMEKYADLQAFITESFGGIESIKTYPSNGSFKNKFDLKQNGFIKIGWDIGEHCILQNSFCNGIDKTSYIVLLFLGCIFVMTEKMSLGQVVSFISLTGFFTNSVENLLDLQAGIQEAFAAIKRLFEILDEKTENDTFSKDISNLTSQIEFKNISFYYDKENYIYDNFNLRINSGEWVSFVGKTGCGKTTLLKLLLKLYKPQKGQILWDNEDFQELNTESIRKLIAYVPQDVLLFSGTIFENITMFNTEIQKDNVIEISKNVGIYEKILTLKHGFDTVIGEKGFSLSGGEKQKIAICRALIKNPSLIIMDEATSNLDTESEKEIIKLIEEQKKSGKTIISIAHRLSTVEKCDKIFLFEKGQIVEQGNFEELKNKKGAFMKMWNK